MNTQDLSDKTALLQIARDAIAASLAGQAYEPPDLGAPWNQRGNVFVTLRDRRGDLRGCVGRTQPALPSVLHEVADCAVASATRDTRVPPVRPEELPELRIEISVLGPPEAVASRAELDPRRYGVIVSHGTRQGVLLPDLPGVDSADQQISIAAGKGGISLDGPHKLFRFEITKIVAS